MYFRMIYDEQLAQAAYLIGCQRTGEAIVIDPERDVDRYIKAAAGAGLRITAVTETHIHADFLSGSRELAQETGATVYLSDEGDADWKYQWADRNSAGGDFDRVLVKDGDVIKIGNIELRVVHTPGHTPEHICFMVTDRGGGADEPMGMATGDFVFVGDLGRPDLLETAAGFVGVKEDSARRLYASARSFLNLPDHLQVWPGHGAGSACGKALGAVPQSTVGYEKRFSPALKAAGDEAGFVDFILTGQPEPPLYFARMKRQNKEGPAVLGSLPSPREIDAKHLAAMDRKQITVLDTRPWEEFARGHIPGSLSAPLDNTFPTIAGSFIVDERAPIYLVTKPQQIDEAIRALIRIGLDRIEGFVTPQALDAADWPLDSIDEIDAPALAKRLGSDDLFVLDVRRLPEYIAGCIPGASNIAHTRLAAHLDQVPMEREVVVACQGGVRSARAASLLQSRGFNVINLAGGFEAWAQSGGKIQIPHPANPPQPTTA